MLVLDSRSLRNAFLSTVLPTGKLLKSPPVPAIVLKTPPGP